jgi:hypothetical protein
MSITSEHLMTSAFTNAVAILNTRPQSSDLQSLPHLSHIDLSGAAEARQKQSSLHFATAVRTQMSDFEFSGNRTISLDCIDMGTTNVNSASAKSMSGCEVDSPVQGMGLGSHPDLSESVMVCL